jgi:hypothetical protein
MFITIETDEKVVQVNAKQLTRVEYELDRVVFHFAGGGSWELQGPTAKQVRKVRRRLGGAAAVGKKKRQKLGSAGLHNGPAN